MKREVTDILSGREGRRRAYERLLAGESGSRDGFIAVNCGIVVSLVDLCCKRNPRRAEPHRDDLVQASHFAVIHCADTILRKKAAGKAVPVFPALGSYLRRAVKRAIRTYFDELPPIGPSSRTMERRRRKHGAASDDYRHFKRSACPQTVDIAVFDGPHRADKDQADCLGNHLVDSWADDAIEATARSENAERDPMTVDGDSISPSQSELHELIFSCCETDRERDYVRIQCANEDERLSDAAVGNVLGCSETTILRDRRAIEARYAEQSLGLGA